MASTTPQAFCGNSFSGGNNSGFFGNNTGPIHFHERAAVPPNYKLGLSLNRAPQIDDDTFIGRERELEQLEEWLSYTPTKQQIVALSGLGGMGKTQLSIHFARNYQHKYSSVIWLNAKDESTLKAGFVDLALRAGYVDVAPSIQTQAERKAVVNQNEDLAVRYIRQWLSELENKEWLLIFDNYDDPRFSGIQSSSGYDIRDFFPFQTQGSILITTRSSRIRFGKQLKLGKLEDVHQSLAILAKYSCRDAEGDVDAHKLAKRLDGLPLALTTAGIYIKWTTETFGTYLQMYEDSWVDLEENSEALLEYEDRTLYSTWNLSLRQVEAQDQEATQLLRLMAYLGNLELWFELFQKGSESGPAWLSTLVKSKARFNKAIGKLQEYSLVEANIGAQSSWYSLHTCVHDWTLKFLNRELDNGLYSLAANCIARNVMLQTDAEYWTVNRRLIQHVIRLEYAETRRSAQWNCVKVEDMSRIAYLNDTVGRMAEAEKMYERALDSYEKALGPDHMSTLGAVNDLGNLYVNQGQMAEAEKMYQRALNGYEKAQGPDYMLSLDVVDNLGNLYNKQGQMAEAEEMYQRALNGKEKVWGLDNISTLNTVNNLGNLYYKQGQMAKAEKIYQRALNGYEKVLRPNHKLTLNTVNNLGNLYYKQGQMAKAEKMYQQALDGKEKAGGLDDPSTLDTVNNLGNVYVNQGQMAEAEKMYQRALDGYKRVWGPEHPKLIIVKRNLQLLREE